MKNRIVAIGFTALTLLLSGCITTGGLGKFIGADSDSPFDVGPNLELAVEPNAIQPRTRLDVIIPVFDPGLPEDSDEYEKHNIWPELRRTEANRFALNMKNALEDTEAFGAVRVTPDKKATGDLYVLGTIKKSNSEDVAIHLEVVDIFGKRWLTKTYKHRVKEAFHEDLRNKGKDPYQPLFIEAAESILKLLRKKSDSQLAKLRSVTDIRFAASISQAVFGEYLKQKNGVATLISLPDENDPMLIRTRAIRVRDQLFVDRMQDHYEAFDSRVSESYAVWQKESFIEVKAARKASRKAFGEAVLGSVLVGLSIAAAANSNPYYDNTGAILGAVAGAAIIAKSFNTRAGMKVHREALAELGESIHVELAPQVIEFENKTVELTGTADEQFSQWRSFLRRIYEEEKTPDTQI